MRPPDDGATMACWEVPVACARVDMTGVSEVFNPQNKSRQLKLCDHVSLWSQNLAQTMSELLEWKDDAFQANAVPLNMLSQLAIITSRLIREKGQMMPPLHQALGLTRSFITGKVVDEEVEALKAFIVEQSNELEMEKMRRVESERKITSALAQVGRLRADQKMQRWSRLYTALRMKQREQETLRQLNKLRSHNNLLSQISTNVRQKASAASGAGSEVTFGATTKVPAGQQMLSLMAQDWQHDMGVHTPLHGAARSPAHSRQGRPMERDLWSREDYGSGSGGGRPFSRDPTGLLKNTYGGEIFDDDEHVVDDADEVDDFPSAAPVSAPQYQDGVPEAKGASPAP